jgi:hypothetical protein
MQQEAKAYGGINSYKKAFNSEFYDDHRSCQHISDVALQESLNFVLERMHSNIRERERIMRRIKLIVRNKSISIRRIELFPRFFFN